MREQAVDTLLVRALWAHRFLRAVDRGDVPPPALTVVQKRALLDAADESLREHAKDVLFEGKPVDGIRVVEAPKSRRAFELGSRQVRQLSIAPQRAEVIDPVEFVKGSDDTAPIVVAVTLEFAEAH